MRPPPASAPSSPENNRTYKILVYGVEKAGLVPPTTSIATSNFSLVFEEYATDSRFSDYDGVILFQGIFEEFKIIQGFKDFLAHNYDRNNLDKRKKELSLLLDKGGFACFVLHTPFTESTEREDTSATDLAKYELNYDSVYRHNYQKRFTQISSITNEFIQFIKIYGAAWSYFKNHNKHIGFRVVARAGQDTVGMIINENVYFIPALVPENKADRVKEFFTLLAEAITSTQNKIHREVPPWLDSFLFHDEQDLRANRNQLATQVSIIDEVTQTLRAYKGVLAWDGDRLVDSVVRLLRDVFRFKVKNRDEFKEDFQLLNAEDLPILFGEIKGTNAGIKREHVNQADSHRERALLPPSFPAVLIINTHIKNSRTIDEKDQTPPRDQVNQATALNILIVRTLDLLRLARLVRALILTPEQAFAALIEGGGWLKVGDSGFELVQNSGQEL